MERIRDVFTFCCLTGLAFTDADHLRPEHIGADAAGRLWIHKPREKTAIMSRIPLLPYTIELLRKYETDKTCRERGRMLPIQSNNKMNAYLKEIAAICNIDKTLTTLPGTRSPAWRWSTERSTYWQRFSATHIPTMTRHYAKFSEQLIGREMQKIGEVFAVAN